MKALHAGVPWNNNCNLIIRIISLQTNVEPYLQRTGPEQLNRINGNELFVRKHDWHNSYGASHGQN